MLATLLVYSIGDQTWKNSKLLLLVFLPQNFPSPHQLTLERAEGVPVDPLSLWRLNRKLGMKNRLCMFLPYFYFRFLRNQLFFASLEQIKDSLPSGLTPALCSTLRQPQNPTPNFSSVLRASPQSSTTFWEMLFSRLPLTRHIQQWQNLKAGLLANQEDGSSWRPSSKHSEPPRVGEEIGFQERVNSPQII